MKFFLVFADTHCKFSSYMTTMVTKDYIQIRRKIRTEMKMAKESWIQDQYQEVEDERITARKHTS